MRLETLREQYRQAREISRRNRLGMILTAAAAAAAAITVFQFFIGIAVVDGTSMAPALGDRAVILYQKNAEATHGDIVVLENPRGETVVKRVIGTEGDEIGVDIYGRCVKNGRALAEPYARYSYEGGAEAAQASVGPGQVFVLGDNRPLSKDSRDYGPVRAEDVRGRVLLALNHF